MTVKGGKGSWVRSSRRSPSCRERSDAPFHETRRQTSRFLFFSSSPLPLPVRSSPSPKPPVILAALSYKPDPAQQNPRDFRKWAHARSVSRPNARTGPRASDVPTPPPPTLAARVSRCLWLHHIRHNGATQRPPPTNPPTVPGALYLFTAATYSPTLSESLTVSAGRVGNYRAAGDADAREQAVMPCSPAALCAGRLPRSEMRPEHRRLERSLADCSTERAF